MRALRQFKKKIWSDLLIDNLFFLSDPIVGFPFSPVTPLISLTINPGVSCEFNDFTSSEKTDNPSLLQPKILVYHQLPPKLLSENRWSLLLMYLKHYVICKLGVRIKVTIAYCDTYGHSVVHMLDELHIYIRACSSAG